MDFRSYGSERLNCNKIVCRLPQPASQKKGMTRVNPKQIKNLVFDMGNVLVRYNAEWVCKALIPKEARKEIISTVFQSQEWIFLDMGVMTEEEALSHWQSRLPDEAMKRFAAEVFWHWHEYNMQPIEGMDELIRDYKKQGFSIYLCSNASVRMKLCYKKVIPAIDCFDGVLFSAEEKLLKPQKEIYERLFSKFSLRPEECFFIDDLEMNIEGARACGMEGLCFTGQDAGKLREMIKILI